MAEQNSAIVKREPAGLMLANIAAQLELGNKVLALGEQRKIRDFARVYPEFFRWTVSIWYPLPEWLIDKYRDKWDWDRLFYNESCYEKAFKPYLTDALIDEIMAGQPEHVEEEE